MTKAKTEKEKPGRNGTNGTNGSNGGIGSNGNGRPHTEWHFRIMDSPAMGVNKSGVSGGGAATGASAGRDGASDREEKG